MFLISILNFDKQCSVRACWAKTFVHREQTRFGRLRPRYPPSIIFFSVMTETQCTHKQHCLANMYTLKPQKNRPRGTALPWRDWWPGSLAEWPTGTTGCGGGWPCALRGRVLCVTPGCWTFCKWTAWIHIYFLIVSYWCLVVWKKTQVWFLFNLFSHWTYRYRWFISKHFSPELAVSD